jgi:hypothetical protein
MSVYFRSLTKPRKIYYFMCILRFSLHFFLFLYATPLPLRHCFSVISATAGGPGRPGLPVVQSLDNIYPRDKFNQGSYILTCVRAIRKNDVLVKRPLKVGFIPKLATLFE